jgi:hypothetical protein
MGGMGRLSMGREIRRIPANWEHPRQDCPHSPWNGGCDEAKLNGGQCYKPLYDEDFESAIDDWIADYQLWKKGEHPDQDEDNKSETFWEWWGDPPDPDYYRPKFEGPAEWYQVYETVSEGTPVTPPFATKEELIDYLVEHGDFWDQRRGDGGWSRENAESFVKDEYAPSFIVVNSGGAVDIRAPRDGMPTTPASSNGEAGS